MQNKFKLQPLRIPSSWRTDINILYEVDPSEETIDWFFGSPLYSSSSERLGYYVDVIFEPEGDPSGQYIVQLYKFENKSDEPNFENCFLIKECSTHNREEMVQAVEAFMEKPNNF